MQSKVPLPTDNIYKFYSLFGLFLFLSCVYVFVNLHQDYNQKAFKRYLESETLRSLKSLDATQIATKNILEMQNKIDASDKKFFLQIIGGVLGISLLLMGYGFHQWHTKIQPQQDKAIEKNLEKLDLEIRSLKMQITKTTSGRIR
jgi:hypothetical protein